MFGYIHSKPLTDPFVGPQDLRSPLSLCQDLVVIPLYVFELQDSAVLLAFEWCTQLFWNFDIILSMHTGCLPADVCGELWIYNDI